MKYRLFESLAVYSLIIVIGVTAIVTTPARAEVDSCSVLDKGLTGHWPFENVENNRVEDTGPNNNHGRLVDATQVDRGRFGKALHFDGFGDHVAVAPDESIRPTVPFTASFWVKLYAFPTEMDHSVKFLSWKVQERRTGWHIWSLKNNNYLQTLTGDGETFHPLKTANPIGKDRWIHILVTRSKDGGQLYMDGMKVDVDYQPVTPPDQKFLGLRIGGWDQKHSLNGLMDEVRVYNRSLADDQIEALAGGQCAPR